MALVVCARHSFTRHILLYAASMFPALLRRCSLPPWGDPIWQTRCPKRSVPWRFGISRRNSSPAALGPRMCSRKRPWWSGWPRCEGGRSKQRATSSAALMKTSAALDPVVLLKTTKTTALMALLVPRRRINSGGGRAPGILFVGELPNG